MTSECKDLCVSVFRCICVRGDASLHFIPFMSGSVNANIRVLENAEERRVSAPGDFSYYSDRRQLWLMSLQEGRLPPETCACDSAQISIIGDQCKPYKINGAMPFTAACH